MAPLVECAAPFRSATGDLSRDRLTARLAPSFPSLVICATCGKNNGEQLVFCEDCGARLQKLTNCPAAPDISFAPRVEPGAGPSCPHCGVANQPGMRFCVACGRPLDAAPMPSPSAPPVAPIADAPRPTPVIATAQIAPAPVVDLGVKTAPPDATRPCWRCRGAVAVNAQFCRFCGAPLSDAPANATAALAPQPTPIALQQTLAVPQPIATAPQPVAAPQPIPLVTTAPITAPAAASPTAPVAAPVAAPATTPMVEPQRPKRLDVTLVSGPPAFDAAGSPIPAASIAAAAEPLVSQAATREMPATSGFAIVSIAQDGGEGARHPIGAQTDIGRTEGDVQVPDDAYLAPRHARLAFSEGKVTLVDLGTANGVYLRVHKDAEVPLVDQDLILVGQQVLRFEVVRGSDEGFGGATQHGTLLFGTPSQKTYARLAQRTTEGVTRDVFHVRKEEWVLGRESGDVVFTQDAFMSRRHAAVRKRGESFFLADLGSSNGTFLQIRGSVHLSRGDELRVGQQLYRLFGTASEGQSGE